MPALLAITVLAFASAPVAHAQPDIIIPTVPIGQPNNDADTTGSGAVGYNYRIGTTEVTNAQYAIFLNAVAKTDDPYALYNADMGSNAQGGINRTGEYGSYEYTVKEGYANKPVNWVTFLDAARFCNWLSNGATESSDTEAGMYTISTGNMVTRNQDYVDTYGGWAIPTEDEWYKAAYYNLNPADAIADDTYTTYATGSSIGTGQANYFGASVTEAKHYAPEQNGTYDMMGNVWEWTEAVISNKRGIRGGSYEDEEPSASSSNNSTNPTTEFRSFGFRVVQLASVPEPATYGILGGAAALLGAVALRRRPRRH